jgi:hypothetical protein
MHYDSVGSRRACACSESGFNSQNGDRAWGVYYWRAAFCWANGLSAKDIHEEMFPVYGGKYLSCKAVHSWVEKRGKRFADDEEVETEVRKSKRLLCCGIRRTGKAMRQVYQCCWRICREINVFSRFEYHMFYVFLSILWPIYWLSVVLVIPPNNYLQFSIGTLC